MIRVITSANYASNAQYLAGFAALRHRVFVERLGWDVPAAIQSKGFEYDRFDTSDTIYMVTCNENDEVVAGLRLLKTTQPFVLAECFPGLAEETIPTSDTIWEVSRFVVDPCAARSAGAHALNTQLVWALHSYGLMAGFSHFVSVSYAGMERMLGGFGCRFRRLGSPRTMDGRRVVALMIDIAEDIVATLEGRLVCPQTGQAGPAPGAAMLPGRAQPAARPLLIAGPVRGPGDMARRIASNMDAKQVSCLL
jgi:N-acyl-L-homoserine lactone synthetase